MQLKIRYENRYQSFNLDTEDTEKLWVSLSLEGDDFTQKQKEELLQKEWEERFNRSEYNSWHKFDRHRGESTVRFGKDDAEEEVDASEPLMKDVADDRIFRRDEIEHDKRESYEDVCQWVRTVLIKKPKWAEAFIAVRMDGVSVNDYAASIGVSDASVISKWLARATKKLRGNYPNRQI